MRKVKILVPMRAELGRSGPVGIPIHLYALYFTSITVYKTSVRRDTYSYLHMPDCSIIHDVVVDDTFRLKNVTVTVCSRGVSHIFLLESWHTHIQPWLLCWNLVQFQPMVTLPAGTRSDYRTTSSTRSGNAWWWQGHQLCQLSLDNLAELN